MKILFLSKIVPTIMSDFVKDNSINNMIDASINFQNKIIRGLGFKGEVVVDLINLLPVGGFPKHFKKVYIPKLFFSHSNKSDDVNTNYLNLHIIKQFTTKFYFHLTLRKQLKKHEYEYILIYSLDYNFIYSLNYVKNKYPKIKISTIVPDLPEYNDLSGNLNIIRRLYDKYSSNRIYKKIHAIDSYVYMTEQTANHFNNQKPYVVIEGISSKIPSKNHEIESDSNEKVIFYSGTTHKQFGIMNLVNAFRLIPYDNFKLVICGRGDSDNEISNICKLDSRIVFYGQITYDEVLNKQKESTVLVNPRQNIGDYTKYSFPSKTMDYLSSGVPLVAYKLDGIPNDYDEYIVYVPLNTDESLANTLIEVCNWSNIRLNQFGKNARRYVLEYKNEMVQAQKIIELLQRS